MSTTEEIPIILRLILSRKNPISSFGSIVLTFRKVFIKRQPPIKSYLIKFLSILLFSKECFIVTATNSVLHSFGDFPWKSSLDGDVVRLEVSNPLIPNGAFSLMVRERLLGGLLAA